MAEEEVKRVEIISRERILSGERPAPAKKPRTIMQLNMVYRGPDDEFYDTYSNGEINE